MQAPLKYVAVNSAAAEFRVHSGPHCIFTLLLFQHLYRACGRLHRPPQGDLPVSGEVDYGGLIRFKYWSWSRTGISVRKRATETPTGMVLKERVSLRLEEMP